MKRFRLLLLASTALVPLAAVPALGDPLGGAVVAGTATIEGSGTGTVTITQSTDKAIIDWNSFDIGSGEITTFVQPTTSSVVLNRVTGGLGPSEIIGTLVANGQVYLVNRDGILFGKDAVIDTGALVATTFDILDEDFLDGNYRFEIPGDPSASVVNLGVITVDDGGFAALVAPGVRNDGIITARLGKIGLASGNGFSLDLYGDSLIKLALSDEVSGEIIDVATGETLKSLVSNSGRLSADGGLVQLTAASTRAIVDSVINNTGNIEANSVGLKSGKIVLSAQTAETKAAGAPAQKVSVSGTFSASGGDTGETGGSIEITGEEIELLVATIDAFGWSGGGTVLIGGDVGGGAPNRATVSEAEVALADHALGNATSVIVDAGTVIDASAIDQGDGGKVIVWSDDATDFAGTILARGGRLGGDGGFVETSGKVRLGFSGAVDASAPNGANGTLLLDPLNVAIDDTGSWVVTPMAIAAALATNKVLITTGTTGAEAGNITVAKPITWSSANTLSLVAANGILVNAGITSAGGADVSLRADGDANGIGTVAFGTSGLVSTSGEVSIFYNPTVNSPGSGVNGTSYVAPTEDFDGDVTGGGTLSAYMLVNTVEDLQNMQNNLGGSYALGTDIDAGATTGWNAGVGFIPIGSNLSAFTGVLNGNGYVIDDLYELGTYDVMGLFARASTTARIFDLGLTDVSITGVGPTGAQGGLVGVNAGDIYRVFVTGTVKNGTYATGLLAGINENGGTITDSYVNGTVSSLCCAILGSLVGINDHGSFVTNVHSGSAIYTSWNNGTTTNAYGGSVPTSLPVGLDPTVWGIDPTYNGGYPYLLWERAAATDTVLAPDGVTPPPPPPGPTLPSKFDQFGTGPTNGFKVVARDVAIAAPTAESVLPTFSPPGGVSKESWYVERNRIGIQYVLANDEVKKQVASLILSLTVRGAGASVGVMKEAKLAYDFLHQMIDAWEINEASRNGEYWKAAGIFSKLVAEAFVDVFGKSLGAQYWLPLAKVATAASTAYIYGFTVGYPLS